MHHFIELIGTLNNKSFSAVSLEAATASLFALQHEAENDVEMKETSSRDSHLDTVTDSAEDDYHEMGKKFSPKINLCVSVLRCMSS